MFLQVSSGNLLLEKQANLNLNMHKFSAEIIIETRDIKDLLGPIQSILHPVQDHSRHYVL